MKNNITILCLSNNYSKKICQKLANELDLFFVDINDILEYNLINDNMLQTAGKLYFDKQQKKAMKGLAQYENSLFRANIELFLQQDNIKFFIENSIVIYIKLSGDLLDRFESANEQDIVHPLFAAEQEDALCSQNCNIVINAASEDENTIKIIKNVLKKYCENLGREN